VAYIGGDNLLKIIECKSYLDYRGVKLRGFDGSDDKLAERFKLFAGDRLRTVVFERCMPRECRGQTLSGLWSHRDRYRPCGLAQAFLEKGWELWDEPWLRQRLKHMSELGYENQVSAVVAKLLLRGKVE
jgi:hypothetical protein